MIDKIRGLFDSIICLAAEGPEYNDEIVLLDQIIKEANKGLRLCEEHQLGEERKLYAAIHMLINFIPDEWPMPLGWNEVVAQVINEALIDKDRAMLSRLAGGKP